ncbi:MAG TPA: hypothetical protein VFC07_03440 [Verrucomicrobiae bacterium]|nr:hypothetical protein [Verrucomicrobiae bacterium]
MNELNQWEKQLQSWIPRRPSARLERQLFSRAADTTDRLPNRMPAWGWLAPATCLFLLATCFSMTRHAEMNHGVASGGSNLLASISRPYGTSDKRCQEWNVLKAVTFDWTKGGSSLSTTGSFPLLKTNIQKL